MRDGFADHGQLRLRTLEGDDGGILRGAGRRGQVGVSTSSLGHMTTKLSIEHN
jgi:hypothetical protein